VQIYYFLCVCDNVTTLFFNLKTSIPEPSRTREQAHTGENTKMQPFRTPTVQTFKPKQAAAFTKNALSTSKWTEIHTRKIPSTRMPSSILSKSGPHSSKPPELFSEDFQAPSSVTAKSKHVETLPTNVAPSMAQVEMAQRSTVSPSSRTSSVNIPSSSSASSLKNVNTGDYALTSRNPVAISSQFCYGILLGGFDGN